MGRPAIAKYSVDSLSPSADELFLYKKQLASMIFSEMYSSKISYADLTKATGISYPTLAKIVELRNSKKVTDEDYNISFLQLKLILDALKLPLSAIDNPELYDPHKVNSFPANDNCDIGFLVKMENTIPINDYYSRILSVFPLLTEEQKKAILSLITCYFTETE